MPTVVVRAGDHLTTIAQAHGFTDPSVVWNRSENQHLKDAGRTPDLLNPGDELFIPEMTLRDMSRGTDARYRATVTAAVVLLKVVLQEANGKPRANASGKLAIGDQDRSVTTDGNGLLTATVPPTTPLASLQLAAAPGTVAPRPIQLAIGYLDPVTTVTGQQSRLTNLGYAAGVGGDPAALVFRSAVEEFQCDQGIGVDGVCGPATQARLRTAHGC